jgi:hypothetical protein
MMATTAGFPGIAIAHCLRATERPPDQREAPRRSIVTGQTSLTLNSYREAGFEPDERLYLRLAAFSCARHHCQICITQSHTDTPHENA